jgi:hypothetical protein
MKNVIAIFLLAILSACSPKEDAPKEAVYNSSYDGSVRQVEDWLDKNLNDPKSVERVEWSPVVKTEQGNFVVRYKFRAKNKFGGMELQNKVFILGSTGIVLAVNDYEK